MSRPAAPASRRKQAVAAVSRSGRSASSRISPRHIEVSGHLGRGDGPQVVPLEVVGLVLELGQVAGRDHGLGQHQRGRPDLLVGVGVAVEGEGGQGPQQAGADPPVEGEHRTRQLGAPLEVEQPELGADLPVGHPLVRRRTSGAASGQPRTTTLSSSPAPSGASGAGRLGRYEQRLADLGLGRLGRRGRLRSSSPRARLWSASSSARSGSPALRASPTSRTAPSPRPAPRRAARQRRGPRRRARPRRSTSAGSTPRRARAALTASGVVSDQPDVDHGGHNGSVTVRDTTRTTAARRRRWRCDDAGRPLRTTVVAVDGLSFTAERGEVLRPARAQRGGQDQHGGGPRGLPPRRRGLGARPRARPGRPTTPPSCPAWA